MRAAFLLSAISIFVICVGCFHDPAPFKINSDTVSGNYSITQLYAVDSLQRSYYLYDTLPDCQKKTSIVLSADSSYQSVQAASCSAIIPFASSGRWSIKNDGSLFTVDGIDRQLSGVSQQEINFWFTGIFQGKSVHFFETLTRQ